MVKMTFNSTVPRIGVRSVTCEIWTVGNARINSPGTPNIKFLLNESFGTLGHESERIATEIGTFGV
jgi:hypothetical protein